MPADTDTVIMEQEDQVATITLNRPDALNAINAAMLTELQNVVRELDGDDDVRAIVLTGTGDGFCAGADLHELQETTPADAADRSETAEEITMILETTGAVTVAAIHGPCLGGGHELALACDFRVAAEDAVMGQPEIGVGLTPGFGATARLPHLIGMARARSMILRGEKLSGVEAYDIGLVDELVDDGDNVVAAAQRFARDTFDGKSPMAYKLTKQMLHDAQNLSLEDALSKERAYFEKMFGSDDREEGIAAFLEDREPEFTGNISNE